MGAKAPARHCMPYRGLILIIVLLQMAGFSFFAPVSDSQGAASIITGTNQDDLFGWNISSAGDMNGDGFDDIVVGAPGYDLGRGRAYIYFCGPWFSGQLKAENANITLNGTTPGDRFGWDVSGAGDVNKDGLDDVIIGSPGNTSQTGAAYIYFGRKFELASLKATSANFTVSGEYTDDLFGASVSGAGDVNNDGYDDVLVGSPGFDKNSGKAYLFLGNGSKKLKLHASTADVMFWGENLDDCFGFSVSDAGNVNKDRYDDVIIGAPGADRAYVFFGGDPMNAWVQTSQADFDSAETNVHIDTTQVIDGEAQLETFHNIKAMMAYFDGSNPPDTPEVPKNRTWNQQLWTSETEANSIGSDENYWFVVESGTVRKNEKILAVSDAGLDIIVQVSEGLSWGPATELTDVVRDNKYQGFDVAYESLSGDAILAYYNDTSPSKLIPKYRTWNGTAWSPEMDAQPVGTGDIHWVLLASNPLSDEILMVTLDRGNKDIYAQVWNGTAWGNAQLIESQASRDDNLCFDVVYEQQTGYGMIVWGGNSGSNKNLNYRRWTGNWSEPAGIMPAADNQVNVVKLVTDPKTDYIIMGNLDNGRRIDVQVWNGTNWSAVTEVAPGNAERNVEHCFDVAYEATGDREGIVVYGIGDHRPVYRLINGTSVGPENFVLDANPPDNGKNPNWILLESDPQTSEIMLTYMIDDGGGNGGAEDDLGCEVWNGTEWKLPQRVELNSTRDSGQHFDVAYTDTSGFLVSAPYDALIAGTWGRLKWTSSIPRETSLTIRTRTSSDGVIWSEWSDWFGNGDRITSPANRWIQYEAYFVTANVTRTPVLNDITIELNRANLTINGTFGEGFGWSVSRAWDVHGDGYDDILVGAPFNGSGNGSAYIFSGARAKSEGDGDRLIDLTNGEAANVTLIGDGKDDLFGYSVSSAGNASSDKYPGVVVGAPGAQKSGAIYIFYGSTSMVPILSASDADAVLTGDGELECFGWSVAWAGNISSTGYDEIAIGAPFYDDMGKTDAGRVYIYNLHHRPDFMINGGGDNEYQGIPTGSQVNVSWVIPDSNISLWIEVENDGTLPDTYEFNITANMLTGWVWKITDNITLEEISDGHSISLSPGENRTFTVNISVPISAVHGEESWVTVTALSQNDTTKKDAVKAVVRALDVTPPEILDTTSGIPSTGDIFAISAAVTDDVIVNNVYLYYWFDLFGGGMNGPYIVTMDPGYTKDVTVPFNAVALHYNISANDTSDNWNETGITSISVIDNDQPSVTDTTSGLPTTGGLFPVTAIVTDNIEVEEVVLYFWFDLFGGGTDGPYSIPMDPGYTKDINVPSDAVSLHYNISTNDTSDNWNETGIFSISVLDNDPPMVMDTTSGLPNTGDIYVLTASVVDNIDVDEVHIYYWFDLYGGGTDGPYYILMDPGYSKDIAVLANAINLHYNISANDTNNNWNETGIITLSILDNDLPLVIDATSGLPTTGDLFPVTATVTDNFEVDQVYLYFWSDLFGGGIDGPYYIPMNPGYTKDINVPTDAVSLHYNISANDTSGNWNETGEMTINILDNDLPILFDISSGFPTTGDPFVVTVSASDNIQIDGVHVFFWFETTGGPIAPMNLSMTDIGGGNYERNINVPANALVFHYKITANDTSDNWNGTGFIILNVLDNDLPDITDTTIGAPTTGDIFPITATVTDNTDIDEVHLYYWFDLFGGGMEGPYNLTMDPGFTKDVNSPSNAVWLHYRISVNDTSNNWNQTNQIDLVVLDNDLPDIIDTTAGSPTTGDIFPITATASDNIELDMVHLFFWFDLYGGGTDGPYNMTMDPGFSKDISIPSNALQLHYYISANDTSDNWNQTSQINHDVLDNDGPQITDINIQPLQKEIYNPVNFTVNITDNIEIALVGINISYPNGSWMELNMKTGSGDQWFLEQSFDLAGDYSFTIWAEDTKGNREVSTSIGFTVLPPSTPSVDYIQIRTEANGGGEVVGTITYEIDEIDTYHAAAYNFTAGYLGDVESDWLCNNEDAGRLGATHGYSSVFTATAPGTGVVYAVYGTLMNQTIFEVSSPQEPEIIGTIPDISLQEDFDPHIIDLIQFAHDGQDPQTELQWYLTGENNSILHVFGGNQTGHQLRLISLKDRHGNMEVTYWLTDSEGYSASQKAWINIIPVNDPPAIAGCPDIFVHFDSQYPFDYSPYISDIDNEQFELVLTTDDPDYTTVNGLIVIYSYPESMVDEKRYVTLTVSDGEISVSQLITVTITSDYPPVTVDEIPDMTIYENETLFSVFDLDDYIMDPDGDSLYMSYGYTHLNITINDNHTVDFSALGEWTGTETVTFRAEDPIGAILEQTIIVNVIPVNDPPVLKPLPPLLIHYDHPFEFDLFWYISDNDNDIEDLVISTSNLDNVSIERTILTLLYPEFWNGQQYPYSVSLTVFVSDGIDEVSRDTIITVGDDYPPVMIEDLDDLFFNEDESIIGAFDLDDYFTDSDGTYMFYSSGNISLIININENNTVDFIAPPNWYGSEYITIRATDNAGAFSEDTILVSVIPVNDPPNINNIPSQIGEKGKTWVLDLTEYLSDIDNDLDSLMISVDGPYVTVVGHILVFSYPQNITEDTIVITVSDGEHETSAPVDISIVSSPAASRDEPWLLYLLPLILAALLILALIKKRAVYNVEDLFLISKGGLLISHVGIPPKSDSGEEKDQDIVAAMFVAVQEFIKDAFSGEKEEDLKRMDYGEKTVLICRGNRILLSAFITGQASDDYYQQMKDFIEDIEERFDEYFGEGNNIIVTRNEEIDTMMAAFLEESYVKGEWKEDN